MATRPRTLPLLTLGLAHALCAVAHAEPGAGTLDDPLVVDALPYRIKGDTSTSSSSTINGYGCAAATDESGPEVAFRFQLTVPQRVTAWVEGDGGGVDIDVHLLDDSDVIAGQAQTCVTRGNVIAEADMSAGERWVIVDTFNGAAQAGPFVLYLDAIGDAWTERIVAEGVTWRARRFSSLNGPQVVHELVVDTMVEGTEIRALAASGCETVGALGSAAGAVAGINGGYFSLGGGCAPSSLLKASGVLLSTAGSARGAFGLTQQQAPMVQIVPANQDWPEAYETHGGGPLLVVGGMAQSGPSAWAAEGFTSAGFIGANPRTFAGFDSMGRSHLATVDGRRANAFGLSLDDLAAFAGSTEIGLVEATNLDGGGSTTMWIADATPNGVVSYPSDAMQEQSTHPGSRANSGGLFVFAPPYNHPPRFQTQPVTQAQADVPYGYDADAIDLDVDDVVSFSLTEGPMGMAIDSASGVVIFTPTSMSPPTVGVTVQAADDRGAATEQSFTLAIQGGMGSGVGAGGGAGSGGAGADAGPVEGGGCGCYVAGAARPSYALLFAAAIAITGAARRSSTARGRGAALRDKCRARS